MTCVELKIWTFHSVEDYKGVLGIISLEQFKKLYELSGAG
jgi:hypothetical protein